jgi:hypothetical protein
VSRTYTYFTVRKFSQVKGEPLHGMQIAILAWCKCKTDANGIESATEGSHKWYTYFDSKLVLGDINLVECQD